ncbi:Nacht domain protein [Apiospora marii]|uniref:Nacht domain protein n=1 Tax=Apiospora marii TaxID=335849 RepID=A0ABR1SU07_9PEZI
MASTPGDSIVAAFEQARHKFLIELKDDKIRRDIQTTTVDQVYTAIADIQKEQGSKGHLRDLQKISPYLDCIKEYAAAIEVFAQVKPDIIALIWGPIKLLLQWTSVMLRSFDAITKTLREIGELLPEFKRVTKLFSEHAIVKEVLVLFFQDILDFYLVCMKFFQMPRWKTLFQTLWPTHYDKVKVVISQIERHTRLLRNEVRLEHIEREHEARVRAMKHFEEEARRRQHEEFHRIKTDASPKLYIDRFLELQGRFCKGTEKWLLDDPTFQQWKDISSTTSNILWLQGIPGAGKTFIASSVAKALSLTPATRKAIVFLSYSDNPRSTAFSVLQSFAFQVVSDDYNLQTVVCQSCTAEINQTLEGTRTFLSTILACAGPTYLILDGLDEMDRIERSLLLDQLILLLESSNETRLFISSRPEADLVAKLDKRATDLPINKHNTPGIQAFVHDSMRSWFARRGFWPEEKAEIEACLKPLASKAKGMFLYASIVLSSVEDLDHIDDIRRELIVLPESLEDAYGRILQRINESKTTARKERARAILGWIACAPTPLTVQEIQQALSIDVERPSKVVRLLGSLDIVEICGPIVEVVDEYARFVHFTVKEYLFSPQVKGFIQMDLATLDLASRCITYLCQPHHDLDLSDDQFYENIQNGIYALNWFASNMWDRLTQSYLEETEGEEVATEAVAAQLGSLLATRKNHSSPTIDDDDDVSLLYGEFSDYDPELDSFLHRTKEFRRVTGSSEHRMTLDAPWMEFDPLTTSRVSFRVYIGLLSLPFRNEEELNSNHTRIRRWYGFESVSQRRLHETHHEKPWRCSIPGCEFEEGGFLSKKMRDDHLDRAHKTTARAPSLVRTNTDETELILVDLAKEGLIDSIWKIFPKDIDINKFPTIQWFLEFCRAAAFSGSAPLLKFCVSKCITSEMDADSYHTILNSKEFVQALVNPSTLDSFKEFIDHPIELPEKRWKDFISDYLSLFANLLIPDARPHFEHWLDGWERVMAEARDEHYHRVFSKMVRATNNDSLKEERLLQFISRTVPLMILCNGGENRALHIVARTTRSCRVAEYLLDRGAEVDHTDGRMGSVTALFEAASEDSARAAALMKWLLLRGADPEFAKVARWGWTKGTVKVRDQKGAQNIAKWLGITWDELVADVRRRRNEVGKNMNP